MRLWPVAVSALFAVGVVGAWAMANALEDFEAAAPPRGWQADAGSKLETTAERFKSGRQSLRWTWNEAKSSLTCVWPEGFSQLTDRESLALWVYNENPMPRILRLELLQGRSASADAPLAGGTAVGQSWYCLNFRGWRPLGAPYAQVLKDPKGAVDGFRLLAQQSVAQGRPTPPQRRLHRHGRVAVGLPLVTRGDLVLTLDGQWDIAVADADAPSGCLTSPKDGATLLRIPYRDFMPVRLTLARPEGQRDGGESPLEGAKGTHDRLPIERTRPAE